MEAYKIWLMKGFAQPAAAHDRLAKKKAPEGALIDFGSLTDFPMARVTGLEPATLGVTGRYSNQLSYTRSPWERRIYGRSCRLSTPLNGYFWFSGKSF